MPNRILKESITTSDTLDQLSPEEERFFCRLIVVADDYGRMDARATVLRARCFPLKLNQIRDSAVEKWLAALAAVDLVRLYEVDGVRYLEFTTWPDHQQVRAKRSKYPQPPQRPIPAVTRPDSAREQMSAGDSSRQQTQSNVPVIQSVSESNAVSESESNSTPPAPLVIRPKGATKLGEGYSEEFERFWTAYPRKREKHGAWRVWLKCLKDRVQPDDLIAASQNAAEYAEREGTEEQYIPLPATFLGPDRKYADFIHGVPEGRKGRSKGKENAASQIDRALSRYGT